MQRIGIEFNTMMCYTKYNLFRMNRRGQDEEKSVTIANSRNDSHH